ncbi:RNA-dependent RNA polymerase [Erysiphe necator associated narnavirus 44]|nr:RNA-dependent RNA polymerase [Erysiphe necator associated narnavirus 44]
MSLGHGSERSNVRASEFVRAQLATTSGSENLKAALQAAYITAFGRNALAMARVGKRIAFWIGQYQSKGDQALLMMKKDLSSIKTMVLEGRPISAVRLGWWFPPAVRRQIPTHPGRRFTVLMQFLKLSRALPVISSKVLRDEAAKEYCTTVCTIGPHRPVPDNLSGTMRKVLGPLAVPTSRWKGPQIFGPASCLGATRRQGGRSSLLASSKDTVSGYKNPAVNLDKPISDYHQKDGLIPMHRMDYYLGAQNRAANERIQRKLDALPTSEALVVPEFGAKLRIVTRSDPDLVSAGHRIRKTYFPILLRSNNRSTSEPLSSDLRKIRFSKKAYRNSRLVFSADFTKATDLLTHESIGLACRLLNVDERLVFAGHSVHGQTTQRGAFMGLPASWTILSLVHYCVAHTVDPKDNFRIKGDDLIALWPPTIIEEYKLLALAVGLVVNDKSAVSKQFGTFCEGDYILRGRTLERVPTHSLRIWARGEIPSQDDLYVMIDRGVKRSRLVKLQRLYLKQWKIHCKRFNLDLYAPIQFGGGGLLHPKGSRPVSNRTSRMLKLAHDGRLHVDPLSRIEEYERPQKGSLIDSMMVRAQQIRWVLSKEYNPLDVQNLDRALGRVFKIATFSDAIMGNLRSSRPRSWRDRARRIARLASKSLARDLGGDPIKITYDEAYRLVGRLTPVPASMQEVIKFDPEKVKTFSD